MRKANLRTGFEPHWAVSISQTQEAGIISRILVIVLVCIIVTPI